MRRLSRAGGWVVARLLPAERREWAEAIWAEADEIPSAAGRLRWYVGGTWLLAKEPSMVRRAVSSVVMAALLTVMAAAAWRPAASSSNTLVVRALPIATVATMALLSLLARRRLGAVADSRVARSLRMSMYLAMTLLIVAVIGMIRAYSTPVRHARLAAHQQLSVASIVGWSLFLLLLAAYVAVILAVTARRSRVAPRTLAIGIVGGVALGATMYAISPLGLERYPTAPWWHGQASDPVLICAWVLLLCGPALAGWASGGASPRSGSRLPIGSSQMRQAVAAGTLVTVVGSLIVCVLGLLTIAGLPHAAWLAQLMHGSRYLPATATHRAWILMNQAMAYGLIWFMFPLIGLGSSALAAGIAWGGPPAGHRGNGPGGGGSDDDPAPLPDPVGEPDTDEVAVLAAGLVPARTGA
jgi:hypothetical protein